MSAPAPTLAKRTNAGAGHFRRTAGQWHRHLQGQEEKENQALRLYTTGSAWFSFDDDELGSIEVGKLADLVVLSDDYLSVQVEEIRTLSSVLTTVGGRVVHADDTFRQLIEA